MQSNMLLLWIDGQFLLTDIILVPIYIIILIFIFRLFKPKDKILESFYYKGLILKILGGIFFWYIHCLIYEGGDSWAYFFSSKAIGELILTNFESAWDIINETVTGTDALNYFNHGTGYPAYYMIRDPSTFSVARYSSIFYLLGFKSFLVSTILVSSFSFIGVWKLFRLVNEIYPGKEKAFFYLIIAIPSLLFWGGGIMKDTFILSSTCWLTYNFYKIFIKRKKLVINIILLIINTSIILNIKSYVIISLLPGVLIWLNNAYLKKISNVLLKVLIIPLFISVISFLGFYTFQNISELMGQYGSIDSAVEQAKIIQQDLLREEQYGKNNYNIGEIDGSIQGMLSLAPMAVVTAIFRPLPWEIGSPMMIISAIENTLMIVFFIFIFFRSHPIKSLRIILNEPYLIFAFTFSIFFAYGVGIASTNFGALVRYKIPLIPFFFTSIYILYTIQKKNR